MNLDSSVLQNKFQMGVSVTDVPWIWGGSYVSPDASLMVTPKRIVMIVSRAAGLTPDQLTEKTKKVATAHPRHIAAMLMRDHCPLMSLSNIGDVLNVDHTCVIYGIRKARQRVLEPGPNRDLYLKVCGILGIGCDT